MSISRIKSMFMRYIDDHEKEFEEGSEPKASMQ